jgi:hypothetical protein
MSVWSSSLENEVFCAQVCALRRRPPSGSTAARVITINQSTTTRQEQE